MISMDANLPERFGIAVVGGGAAGHAAAIAAAHALDGRTSTVILERAPRVGRKLLATGNGRCNITHLHAGIDRYHGTDPEFVRPALAAYPPTGVMAFFDGIGVPCRAEPDGRVYPYGAQASAVQDALRLEAVRRGVLTVCGFDVASIVRREPILLGDQPLRPDHPFEVTAQDGRSIRADAVILATGGPAGPQLGGTDAGYTLLRALGHSCVRPIPSIVQIMTEKDLVKSLSGIRVEGVATLVADGRAVRAESGEILFTDYGLSGPPLLQLGGTASRILAGRREAGDNLEISLDFFPDMELGELAESLESRAERLTGVTGADFLSGMLNKRVGQAVVKAALGIRPSDPIGSLARGPARRLAEAIKGTRVRVTGVHGWREAQVTAGGVRTSEFDARTMESLIVPGLYACGELLDIDGDCGGYNLQWAWCSGMTAGNAAAGGIRR